ncbi:MAG: bifunctional diguanylate cyclase/phosphodiesterase [Lachnospiraceae bacterium]|nr:bifunctional diguanylate cyclase/phosphodiesterase [Lachnospiraceae bacterium]
MKENDLQLHHRFLQSLTFLPAKLETLREALLKVGPRYHVFKLEVEQQGNAAIIKNQKQFVLFEDRRVKESKHSPYTVNYHYNDIYGLKLHFVPAAGPFTDEEKELLELYAMDIYFYLLSLQAVRAFMDSRTTHHLTGLLNYSGYIQKIIWLMEEGVPLSFYDAFYINIQGFGSINKRLGHQTGDELIRRFAEIIKSFLKEDEIAAHMGGDNFAVLLRKSRKEEFIGYLADVPIVLPKLEEEVHLASRAGIWEIVEDKIDPADVINRPVVALNQAKNVLHQPIAYATERMLDMVTQRKGILVNYQQALDREEFMVYYQPKVDSRDKKLVGAESLVRWQRDGKLVSPGVFIPPLEENGLIVLLDYYVLKRTCEDLKKWIDEGYEPVPVSVNFSRKDLEDKNLAENINNIIETAGIDKKLIQVEVTETSDAEEHGELAAFIDKLYRYGIMTAIDDFGSGYSSLSTLREYHVHTLKIDRSFVNNNDFSWKDEIILKDIIHMAQELGIETLTEGVERDDQLFFVNSVGCYVIQGYYYDKPLPRDDFERRLKNKQYK